MEVVVPVHFFRYDAGRWKICVVIHGKKYPISPENTQGSGCYFRLWLPEPKCTENWLRRGDRFRRPRAQGEEIDHHEPAILSCIGDVVSETFLPVRWSSARFVVDVPIIESDAAACNSAAGMMTDTGLFIIIRINWETYTIVSAKLIKKGLYDLIHRKAESGHSECRLRMMGICVVWRKTEGLSGTTGVHHAVSKEELDCCNTTLEYLKVSVNLLLHRERKL